MKWPFGRKINRQSTINAVVQSRPDYYQPYRDSLYYLPPPNDPIILESLRRALPILNAATDQLVRLTGNVKIVWDSQRVQDEWDVWAQNCRVAPLGKGFNRWLNGQQERALIGGTGASEILIDPAGRDIAGFQYLSARSLRMRVDENDPTQVVIAQQQTYNPVPVQLDPDFIVLNAHAPRDDSPYGRSLFTDIPFVAELLLEMIHAQKQNWERMGARSYAVNVEVPPGLSPGVDVGSLMNNLLSQIKTSFTEAMASRKRRGVIKDFFGAGNIKISTIGADGTELEFQIPWRSAMEQIIAATHLPSWMLGLHWATTERLSDEQAQTLEAVLNDYRDEYTPSALKVATLWAMVRGYGSAIPVAEWPETSLRDQLNAARAQAMQAQAESIRERTGMALWRSGVFDQEEYAEYVTGEETVEIATPMLEPPALPSPVGFGGSESASVGNLSARESEQKSGRLTYGV